MRRGRILATVYRIGCGIAVLAGGTLGRAAVPPTFEDDVRPILEANCVVCHGGSATQQGLDLRTAATVFEGGVSGPAVEIGDSAGSLLVARIASGSMPPGDAALAEDDVDLIRRWVDEGAAPEGGALASDLVTERDVLPIFQARCVVCHGKREQRGGLDLRTQASRLAGGDSGPALVPGKPAESLIVRKVEAGEMPPPDLQYDYAVRNPTDAEVATLRRWVAAGAPADPDEAGPAAPEPSQPGVDHWAFVPPARPSVPRVRRQDLVANPIDAFLLRRLEEEGLAYSEEAGPLTLLRRAYLGLTGMPPLPADVERYLADDAGERYALLIDRLLDSPEYGERWARHWLDVAGFIDTEGYGAFAPPRPNAWRFRDYAIRAFNRDKPFDEFLVEQIAGDELAPWKDREPTEALVERLAATGFLRTAPDPTWEIEFAFLAERMNVIADEVQILASGILGLTVGCARCHDHKYDPITQSEYYSLAAILQSAYDPYDWLQPKDRAVSIAVKSEREAAEAVNAPLKAKIDSLRESLKKEALPFREQLLDQRLGDLPDADREELRKLLHTPEEERTDAQNGLAKRFAQALDMSGYVLKENFEDYKKAAEPIEKRIDETKDKLAPEPGVRALVDMGGRPSASFLLRRGDAMSPGRRVAPGVPQAVGRGIDPYEVLSPWPGADSSGRRLALARWLTQPDHPLTARVMVNRMWMRHFGRGIVGSPDDFGSMGSPPTHPELLDWLATEFVRSGWSVKHMQRLMLTSRAYRQASRNDGQSRTVDPDNALLGRMSLRRMDAEQLYDSVLRVTGRLDPTRFGTPAKLEVSDSGESRAAGSSAGYRRSIYTMQEPSTPITLLEAYDFPRMTPNCIVRSRSNVATQALQLMNSEWTWELARYMAGRIIDEAGAEPRSQAEAAFVRTLARRPTDSEMREAVEAMAALQGRWPHRLRSDRSEAPIEPTARWLALANLCHTLLNTAEFAFID